LSSEFGCCRRGVQRTANRTSCILSNEAIVVLNRATKIGPFVFSIDGAKPFQEFSRAKRELDKLSGVKDWRLHDLRRTCVSGTARLGIPPHVADKILNHQSGTISGVAAVYQRHDFRAERKEALERWGTYVRKILTDASSDRWSFIRRVA
jgi:integrase